MPPAEERMRVYGMLHSNIQKRNKSDLVMNGITVSLVLALPAILFLILVLLTAFNTGKYRLLSEYVQWIPVLVLLEFVLFMAILHKMYCRLQEHSERDKIWYGCIRSVVILYKGSTEKLDSQLECMMNVEKFRWKNLSTAFLVLMVAYIAYVLLFYMPGIDPDSKSIMLMNPIFGALALILLESAIVFKAVLKYPYEHEK